MNSYDKLLENNKAWAKKSLDQDPEFFRRLTAVQNPKFLWIGCSDSRVPADMITGTQPGEIFVHRNVANLVVHTDLNLLTVLDYAVNYLEIDHIIVCGHYGCGGVKAAMSNTSFGLINHWILNIKDVYHHHAKELDAIEDEEERLNKLIDYNVRQQVINLAKTHIVQRSWKANRSPSLHAWVYDLRDGLVNNVYNLEPDIDLNEIYKFEEF